MPELSWREAALLAPIAAVVLWMGVYPESFLAPMRKDAGLLVARVAAGRAAQRLAADQAGADRARRQR